MRIIQGVILVLMGALGAMVYVKIKSAPEPQTVQTAVAQQTPGTPPEAEPLPVPTPPSAESPAEAPASRPRPVRTPKKHSSRAASSPARDTEPIEKPPVADPVPSANPTVAQAVPETQPAPRAADPEPAPTAVEAPPPPPEANPEPSPRQAILTAGTLVSVRLQDTISSDRYHAGDIFTAALDRPLVVDGVVIAEKGARAEGKIIESQQAGRVKGLAVVALELTRVKLSDGQHVEISTDSFTKKGPESHEADAAKIGGGAALGAIIGAIAGGGKGAAIGAGVGGAAGTGAVIGTRGKPAVLPSETRISFRINQTITVTERRRS
jgi:hypothetical protein